MRQGLFKSAAVLLSSATLAPGLLDATGINADVGDPDDWAQMRR
jgi:hypothetical protein